MNNPQAFPQSVISPGETHVPEGATLLDLFAKDAMQSFIINLFPSSNMEEISRFAYQQAEAMLKERENWLK